MVLGFGLVAGIATLLLWPRPPAPPPVAAAANSPSDFLGDAACARCHPGEAFLHARSGHARTLVPTRDSTAARRLAGRTFHDPEREVTYHYRLTADGLVVTIPEKLGDAEFPIDWAFGSGEHAVTFLTLIPNRAGETVGIEHRVSWFGLDQSPGLTPSHGRQPVTQQVEQFGRVMRDEKLAACVRCHTTTAEIADARLVNLRANVGCERCHGPGSHHVRAVESGAENLEVLFGTGKTSAADQIRMCGECHRHPDSLHETRVATDNPRLARFQPVGLLQSACYLKSGGRLSCTTCHDPHEHVPREREKFDSRCTQCHNPAETGSRVCSVNTQSDCVTCHMPAVEVRPGIRFHDHWIRIRQLGEADGTSLIGDDPASDDE